MEIIQYLLPIAIGVGIGGTIIVSFLIFRKFRKTNKMKILYYDTDKTCNIKDYELNEGKIKIGKKLWNIAKENTYMFRDKGRIFPFMILKHDSSKSVDVVSKAGSKGISPDEQASLLNMAVLKQLLEPVGALTGKFALGFSMVMLGFGVALGIALVSMGVISV